MPTSQIVVPSIAPHRQPRPHSTSTTNFVNRSPATGSLRRRSRRSMPPIVPERGLEPTDSWPIGFSEPALRRVHHAPCLASKGHNRHPMTSPRVESEGPSLVASLGTRPAQGAATIGGSPGAACDVRSNPCPARRAWNRLRPPLRPLGIERRRPGAGLRRGAPISPRRDTSVFLPRRRPGQATTRSKRASSRLPKAPAAPSSARACSPRTPSTNFAGTLAGHYVLMVEHHPVPKCRAFGSTSVRTEPPPSWCAISSTEPASPDLAAARRPCRRDRFPLTVARDVLGIHWWRLGRSVGAISDVRERQHPHRALPPAALDSACPVVPTSTSAPPTPGRGHLGEGGRRDLESALRRSLQTDPRDGAAGAARPRIAPVRISTPAYDPVGGLHELCLAVLFSPRFDDRGSIRRNRHPT